MCHDKQPPPGGGPKFQACRVCETTSNSKGHPKCRHVPPRWASAFSHHQKLLIIDIVLDPGMFDIATVL